MRFSEAASDAADPEAGVCLCEDRRVSDKEGRDPETRWRLAESSEM